MKWFLIVLMAHTSMAFCSERIVTLHDKNQQQRIVTLHLSRIPQHVQHHKAYKRAFLRHNSEQVKNLSKNQCSTAIPKKQKKAILAITARTHNPKTRRDLFNAGIEAGLYTCAMARKSAHAMQRHAQQLKRLARQHKPYNSRKILAHDMQSKQKN